MILYFLLKIPQLRKTLKSLQAPSVAPRVNASTKSAYNAITTAIGPLFSARSSYKLAIFTKKVNDFVFFADNSTIEKNIKELASAFCCTKSER